MSYTCAKFQGNKKNDLSTLVFLNQNSQNFTIISLIFNLKPEFFRIFQKKGPNFRKLRNLTYLELHVIQFWAKKKTFLDHSSFIHCDQRWEWTTNQLSINRHDSSFRSVDRSGALHCLRTYWWWVVRGQWWAYGTRFVASCWFTTGVYVILSTPMISF